MSPAWTVYEPPLAWLALFAAGAGVSAAVGARLSAGAGAGVSAAAPPPGTLIL